MSIIRSLDSFSLPELFKLINNNSYSGRLIVETPISQNNLTREGIYYIWFENGCLIAVSNCINQKGLIDLIDKRGWISPLIVSRLRKLCPTGMPLGIYLQKMKLLNPEKLSLIFQLQLHQVYRLFQLNKGRFRFDNFAELQNRILTIPWLEMTGHRINTSEVSMYALRLMENSENFVGQLPSLSQSLKRIVVEPHLKLTAIERELWNSADSKTSLLTIAKVTHHSLATVQMTAFRLIAVGLVEEVVLSSYDWEAKNDRERETTASDRAREKTKGKETSLLQNLGGLFKKK